MKVLASTVRSIVMICAFTTLSLQAVQWKISRKHRVLTKAYTLINHDQGHRLFQCLLETEPILSSDIKSLLIYAIKKESIRSILQLLWPYTFRGQTTEKIRKMVQSDPISNLHQKIWELACNYLCNIPNEKLKKQCLYALHNAGVNINACDPMGQTLLHSQIGLLSMSLSGCATTAYMLLEAGADPTVRDNDGETTLHEAARLANKDLVLRLIRGGAKVNQPDYIGATALTVAATEGREAIVELFLENGAVVSRLDIDNARIYGHRKLAQRLRAWRETHKPNLVTYVKNKLKTNILTDDTQTREQAVEAAVEASVEKMVQTIEGYHSLQTVIPEMARSGRYPDDKLAASLEEWSASQEGEDLLTHVSDRLGLGLTTTKREELSQNKISATRAAVDTLVRKLQEKDPLLKKDIPMVPAWQQQCKRVAWRI